MSIVYPMLILLSRTAVQSLERKSVARRAAARRATLFLSFWGGVGKTFDDFREALQSLLELRYHALT